jgi:hypothetical protein
MSKYTINQYQQPSSEEVSRWSREAEYFAYTPPNPSAPPTSPASRGWGVPKEMKPPVDVVEYVNGMFKREVAQVAMDAKLRPEFRWSIFSVIMAHFLWFRTEEGWLWLARLFGVEEIEPFTDGYVYIGNDKSNPVGGQPGKVLLDEANGIKLRIFGRCDRSLDPAISSANDETIASMKALLRRARNPNANEAIPESASDMYFWVSEQVRDWLIEPTADRHWPTYKADRISGPQWVKTVERQPGRKVFEAIDIVEKFGGRAYRISDAAGNVRWCGSKDDAAQYVRVMTKPDYLRVYGGVSEAVVGEQFRCKSCGKVRPCTPVTKAQHLCCHCMGSLVEKDRRPTLDWCTMKECKNCPDHLESEHDLVNLKNRLNRDAAWPVRR